MRVTVVNRYQCAGVSEVARVNQGCWRLLRDHQAADESCEGAVRESPPLLWRVIEEARGLWMVSDHPQRHWVLKESLIPAPAVGGGLDGTDQTLHCCPSTLIRPLRSDTGGGGGLNWLPGILADPSTHPHQKSFSQKNEIYQRGPNLEVNFGDTNFFLASNPPPPPR